MKNFLFILFFLVVIGLGIGFYLKIDTPSTGDFFIGISLMLGFFVLMPLFVYHRWKDKNVSDYMLNKENIMKMHEHQNKKKNRK